MMVSETMVDDQIPLLPPIKTSAVIEEKHIIDVSKECVTPKFDDCILKPSLVCPPAPRKPRRMKRKSRGASRQFFIVPTDLSSVFLALPVAKKQRIQECL
ncbi:hypothetical protein IHE45_03G007900 [Dioscorea alata]|uniref:Uncharacterized protein n=1 Tax=Dioscorea alata TaxID=55571 RepID=A0ACB7WJ79_DIOAL|nr:hypothetical protein IHE45_03G007900 [Dioscorea alata]